MPFSDDSAKADELARMRRLATGLFVLVALLYLVTFLLERTYPAFGFVRAFCEAAMVGALADWFAVTALFRHPLGLPIPHTAIVPRRKDSIGASIGRFVQENFLSEDVLVGRLRSGHFVRRAARWLSIPQFSARVAEHATTVLSGALGVVNDEDVQQLIERSLVDRLQTVQTAPLVGRAMGLLLQSGRQQELVLELIRMADQLLEENKEEIRRKIREEAPWWLPKAVERHIADRLFVTIETTLHEVRVTPDHPMYDKFNNVISAFMERLRSDPETIAKGEAIKQDLLQNPIVKDLSMSLWGDIKRELQAQSASPNSTLRVAVQQGVQRFGTLVQNDAALEAKLEHWIERIVVYVSQQYRHNFGQLIAQTVSRWDADMTANKIELQVGRDLQFIRINGTIVGGLAGLVIYSLSQLLR